MSTGIKLSEIVAATMGALYSEGDGRWWLDVAKTQRTSKVAQCHVADGLGSVAEAAVNLGIFIRLFDENFAACRKLTVPIHMEQECLEECLGYSWICSTICRL